MLETLNLPVWAKELIIIGAILIGTFVAAAVSLWFLRNLNKRLAAKTKTTLDDDIIKAVTRPVFWFILVMGFSVLMDHLTQSYPEQIGWTSKYADGVIWTIGAILVTIIAMRLVNIVGLWLTQNIAQKADAQMYSEFLPLFNRAVRMVTLVVAMLIILDHFNIDIKALLTVLGVGSLAVALAAKDTIENMISGFIIMVDRPFRVGDRVILTSGEKCDVYHIGLRSTRFITFENTLIILPNRELLTSKIENISYPDSQIRIKVNIGVAYGADMDKVRRILLQCASDHPKVLESPKPKVHMIELGDSSVDFSLRGRAAAITDQWTTQNELREMIYDKLNEANIEIPFPQRTVWMKRDTAAA
jgi:small-conductance mechanosensitive channel